MKAQDLVYRPPCFIRSDVGLREALKTLHLNDTNMGVIKKGKREVGMVGITLLKQHLGLSQSIITEENQQHNS